MSNIKKPQRLLMTALFNVLMAFPPGKANFRNISRYSNLSGKRLSRWDGRLFAFAQFNMTLLCHTLLDEQDCIAAIDARFINKSGKQTESIGWFYNGSLNQSQRGLGTFMICRIDLKSHIAYVFKASQILDQPGKKRVDSHAKPVVSITPQL